MINKLMKTHSPYVRIFCFFKIRNLTFKIFYAKSRIHINNKPQSVRVITRVKSFKGIVSNSFTHTHYEEHEISQEIPVGRGVVKIQ